MRFRLPFLPGHAGLLAALALALVASPATAQVCTGITLSSQSAVDAFSCEEVTGRLFIGTSSGTTDITDLTPLSELTSAGALTITGNPGLTSLNGLGALQRVTGYRVRRGFTGYRYYNGYLTITDNAALTSLGGLSGLVSAKTLTIDGNDALTSLGEFRALTSVGGLTIAGNPKLASLGEFSALTSVGRLTIAGNPMLASLDGLDALTSVNGYTTRRSDGETIDQGGSLTINGNASLTSLGGLRALSYVKEWLTVTGNASLTSLGELGALASVGALDITDNSVLASLDGLSALEQVRGYWVRGTYSSYFRGGTLAVRGNAALETCSCGLAGVVDDDRTAFSGVVSAVYISDNLSETAGGVCTSPGAVLATACGSDAAEPVACTASAPLSFDADGSSGDGSTVTDADFSAVGTESVGVRHEADGGAAVDLSGCSFVSFDPFTEQVTFAAATSGEVDPDDVYTLATSGGDQAFGQSDVLFDDPGAFALVSTTGGAAPPQPGDDVSTVFGRVVAAVVYDRQGGVFASVRGGLPEAEAAEQAQTFAAAMASVFGRATPTEGGAETDLEVRAWPNPTRDRATVAFGLAEGGAARVAVYDALGREVAVLAEGTFAPGRHEAALAAPLPAGAYVVRVVTEGSVQTARLTVAR